MTLTQTSYIARMGQRFDMSNAAPVDSPMPTGINLDDLDSPLLPTNDGYQALVGSILYCSTKTRPDIAFAVGKLARYTTAPKQVHMTMARPGSCIPTAYIGLRNQILRGNTR